MKTKENNQTNKQNQRKAETTKKKMDRNEEPGEKLVIFQGRS